MTTNEAIKIVSKTTPKQATDLPVQRAIAAIREMKPEESHVLANKLFPGNHAWHQRALFYTWARTVQNRVKKHVNPKIYPLNFIGAPGYGKSAITYSFGHVMSEYLTTTYCREGEDPIKFEILVRTVGSITDVADLFGLVCIDNDEEGNKRTKLATPSSFPMTKNSVGLLFLDDYNRAQGFILGGLMEFVNTGKWNDAEIPDTWGIALASNPSGMKGNKVTSLDAAQMSRSINVAYSRSLETYFEQLYKQDVDPILQTFYHKFKDGLNCPSVTEYLPEPVINDRTRMMFNHMYPMIKNDKMVLTHVSESMFGPNMMTELTQVLEGDLPVEPWEILGSNDPQHEGHIPSPKKAWEGEQGSKKKIDTYVKARKTDLVVMTSYRLAFLCNDKDVNLDKEQIENLCNFIEFIPEDIGMDIMRKLLYTEGPKTQFWRETLLRWKSPDGVKSGPLAEKFMTQHKRINTAVTDQLNSATPSKTKKK